MSRNELLKQNYHFCTVRETVKCAPTQLIIHPSLQNIFSSTHWSLWWIGCVQLRRGRSSSTRETCRANWWPDRAGWQSQVMAQPSSLLEKLKIKSQNCHTNFGGEKSWHPCNVMKHRLPGAPILEHLKYSVDGSAPYWPSLGNVVQCWVHTMSIIVSKRNMMNKSSTSTLWSRNKHGCKGWELLFQKNVIGHRF